MNQADFNKLFINYITSECAPSDWATELKDSSKLSAIRALEVYKEDYQVRLTEALKSTYRACHRILGDDSFYEIAQEYINQTPSSFSDLEDYGHLFPHFLKEHSRIFSELAHFEWAFKEIFHLPEVLGVNSEELGQILNSKDEKLILASSVRLLDYTYKIDELFSTQENFESTDRYSDEQYILLFKKNSLVKMHLLSKNQWEFMKKFHAPHSLLHCLQNAPVAMTPEEVRELFQILGSEQILVKSL